MDYYIYSRVKSQKKMKSELKLTLINSVPGKVVAFAARDKMNVAFIFILCVG